MSILRDRPNPIADNGTDTGVARGGRYGERYSNNISNKEMFAADEGSYFVAISPTAGTGIIGHAAPTTFDEAKPYLTLYNGGQNRIYPQFLHLHETVAGVGHTRLQLTVSVDTGLRRTSAGTALVVNNVNMDSNVSSGAQVYAGAVVAAAATGARRLLGNYVFRGTIDIIEDSYELVFGGLGTGSVTGSRVATVADMSRSATPAVVGPGQSLLIVQWAGSQTTGPTFEVVLGFIER